MCDGMWLAATPVPRQGAGRINRVAANAARIVSNVLASIGVERTQRYVTVAALRPGPARQREQAKNCPGSSEP